MLSIIFKQKVMQSKLGFKLDQTYNVLVGIIILPIFILAYNALQRPINTVQYQKVIQYAHQASHPRTQHLAEDILEQAKIRRVDYLKLLSAYQFESNRIKQYPAMAKEDE
ncbi:hypothetical protein F909_02688 [Acinetobacter sp. ANC 3929]|uniref:hypothetical protein n=1 Tax=unclassified Acinetobacter TaxID=196816 RepID=UPI0002CE9B14|nr:MULTISPECIES: hypothetical protein [unclassified Acinetobacter]ENW81397.1 hypothetical protein F909_02688 [Acinetobacter sp. ANC 3929]MCH7353024.1 hypothetical protein [Acinetobacter sp. NIPH 2023]MCH7354435.1 hypothetical protein [Acinetobacter sp. NIPH 1958]MCH7360325.1 hypothetical protein [Acinetobacter sp. NIPH 2024]